MSRRSVKACCHRANDALTGIDRFGLACRRCGAVTCGVHAYLGSRGEWRCAGCFHEVDAPREPVEVKLAGGVPPPAGSRAHVVVVVHGLHICGVARHCLELLAALTASNVHTSVIALQGGGHWADRFLDRTNDLTVYSSPSMDGSELQAIEWRAPRRVVSAHYDPAVWWAVRSPLTADYFAHFHTEPEFGLFTRAALFAAGERCRRIAFPSATTRDSYRALLHDSPPAWWKASTTVLPNAVPDFGAAPEPPAKPQIAQQTVNLGIVSRVDPDKMSIPLLLDTIDILRRQLPGLRVRIAGNGVIRAQLGDALVQRGLDEYVELLGWVDDIAPVYAWSHVTYLPSHSETMPYAAIESVRFGRPVAVPALGHFAEPSSGAELIYRFLPGDAHSAATAIVNALDRPHQQPGGINTAVDSRPFDPVRWRRHALALYGLLPAVAIEECDD